MPATTKFAESVPVISPSVETSLSEFERTVAEILKTGECKSPLEIESAVRKLAASTYDAARVFGLSLDASVALYVTGHPGAGLKVTMEAEKFARTNGLLPQIGQAKRLQGLQLADLGDIPSAIDAYVSAIADLQQHSEVVVEGKCWQNLGVSLIYAGLHRDALACFQISIACDRRRIRQFLSKSELDSKPANANLKNLVRGVEYDMAAAYSGKAHCYLAIAEYEKALDCVSQAHDFQNRSLPAGRHESHHIVSLTILQTIFVRIFVELGDTASAKAHAIKATHFAAQTASPRAKIQAKLAEGMADIFSEAGEVGVEKLRSAAAQAQELGIAHTETLKALVRAYEKLGNHEAALLTLKKLLEFQRVTQETNLLNAVRRRLVENSDSSTEGLAEEEERDLRYIANYQEALEGRVAKQQLAARDRDITISRVETIERMAVLAELRDDASGEHSYRVGKLSSLLASKIGCEQSTVLQSTSLRDSMTLGR